MPKTTCHEKKFKSTCITRSSCDIRIDFAKLWSLRTTFTKFYINSYLADLPDVEVAANRLLTNQDDIGNFLKPCIGEANGNEISKILREQIILLSEALLAAFTNDQSAFNIARDKLFANSAEFATFITTLNPCKISLDKVVTNFNQQVQYTLDMIIFRVTGDYASDFNVFDFYYEETLKFSDILFEGIIKPCIEDLQSIKCKN